MKLPKWLGKCYEAAVEFIVAEQGKGNSSWTLVYGTITAHPWVLVIGSSTTVKHAWAECGNTVVDRTQGDTLDRQTYRRDDYYSRFQVRVHRRYDWWAMALAMLEFGTYGPWPRRQRKLVS